jgi:hypothetical protein
MDKRIIMKKYQLTGLLLIIFSFNSISLLAQNPPVFDDNVTDVNTTPIDNWTPYLLLLAISLGYFLSKRKQTVK